MELFEQAVLAYLTGPPHRFVRPQFSLEYRGGVGGSVPDFVVLDFSDEIVYIIEVTAAYSIGRLIDRVRERQTRWYRPLLDQLVSSNQYFASWRPRTTIFVRADRKQDAMKALDGEGDVTVIVLDDIMRSWQWNWEKQLPVNPLDRDPAQGVGRAV
jgi:hypothetical protein